MTYSAYYNSNGTETMYLNTQFFFVIYLNSEREKRNTEAQDWAYLFI